MPQSIIIDGILDITKFVVDSGKETARFSGITAILEPERDFILDDSKKSLSPFETSGILNPTINGWVDLEIKVFDSKGFLEYFGLITDVIDFEDRTTRRLTIKSREASGIVLDVPIESVDSTTYIGFLLDGDHGKGTSQLLIKSGVTDIPDICILTYTQSLVPNYQITNPQGSPTVNFDLDRPIEADLLDNLQLTINVPKEKTAIEEMKDVLNIAYNAIGLPGQVNDSLFDAIRDDDEANGRRIIFYIRLENNINLGQHLRNISNMTGYHIRKGSDGRMEPVKQIQWNGLNPQFRITDDEIVYSQKKTFNKEILLFGYDLPYKFNNDEVRKEKKEIILTSQEFRDWKPRKIKRLNTYQDILPVKNPYIYNSQNTAIFYGDKFLNYYSIARERFNCRLNSNFVDKNPIGMKLFDVFLLTTDDYDNEPVRCLNFEFDNNAGVYNNVIFELINKGFPDLPKP